MTAGAVAPRPSSRVRRPRPSSILSRLTFVALVAAIMSAFVFSPALYFRLGINYAGAGGSPLIKIHIALYLALVALVLTVLARGRLPFRDLPPASLFWPLGLVAYSALQLLVLGRPVSGLLVTFGTPILLMYLLTQLSLARRVLLGRIVLAFLLANALVGLAEALSGTTLLPRVAGTIVVTGDGRALGLVGHALTASFLSGCALLYLCHHALTAAPRIRVLLALGIHGAALIAFGGRLALISVPLLLFVLIFLDRAALSQHSARYRVQLRVCALLLLALAAPLVLASGFADPVLARFVGDGGSMATRWAALRLVMDLTPEALFLGLDSGDRARLLARYNTPYGVESTWLGWLVDYGALISAALAAALFIILRTCLATGQRVHFYVTAFFLIIISGAQGLGAKSLLLAWVVVLLLTLDPADRSAWRSVASSSPRSAPLRRAQTVPANLRLPPIAPAPGPGHPHR